MKSPFLRLLLCLSVFLSSIQSGEGQSQEYDYIVVGAGSAGSIVAAELARKGTAVLLIEAGSDNTDPAISDLKQYFNVAFNPFNFGWLQWGYQTVEQTMSAASPGETSPRSISLPRGKALGGTHSINAGAYVQANAEDFDSIARELDDKDWQWKRTAKYRHRIEKKLGIVELGLQQAGAEEFIDAAKETLGFPYNEDPKSGYQYGISPSFWTAVQTPSGGRRRSTFDSFVLPLIDSHSIKDLEDEDDEDDDDDGWFLEDEGVLHVVTHHLAETLIFDPKDNTKVVGVRCYNARSFVTTDFVAKKEVIVSAGTYNSPQLLMRSGIGPDEHLKALQIPVRKNLPGVGSNLRDHYGVATFWNLEGLEAANPFLFQSPSMNMFGPEPSGLTTFQIELSGNFGSCVPLRQQSTGTVRLASSYSTAAPIIDPNILSTETDIEELVECLQHYLLPFFSNLIQRGLLSPGNIDPDLSPEKIRQFVLENVASNHHPVGTCKVGLTSDDFAVVDKDFKVHGLTGLRVIDASVFPRVPSSNINGPTMTMAMIGARKILKERKLEIKRGIIQV